MLALAIGSAAVVLDRLIDLLLLILPKLVSWSETKTVIVCCLVF
jgi:hypothetical protein